MPSFWVLALVKGLFWPTLEWLFSNSSHALGWLRSSPCPPTAILQEAGRGCTHQATTCYLVVEHRSLWLPALHSPGSSTQYFSKGSVLLNERELELLGAHPAEDFLSQSLRRGARRMCCQPHSNHSWWPVRRWKPWEGKYMRLIGEGRGDADSGPLRGRPELAQITLLLACLISSWDVFNNQFHQNEQGWHFGPLTAPTMGTVSLGFPSSHQRAT